MLLPIKTADEELVSWPRFGVYLPIPIVRVTLHDILDEMGGIQLRYGQCVHVSFES